MITYPLFLGSLGFWEILLIVLVILLLFGGKKIPELMKGLGKGVKSFKKGMQEVEDNIKDVAKELESDASDKENLDVGDVHERVRLERGVPAPAESDLTDLLAEEARRIGLKGHLRDLDPVIDRGQIHEGRTAADGVP